MMNHDELQRSWKRPLRRAVLAEVIFLEIQLLTLDGESPLLLGKLRGSQVALLKQRCLLLQVVCLETVLPGSIPQSSGLWQHGEQSFLPCGLHIPSPKHGMVDRQKASGRVLSVFLETNNHRSRLKHSCSPPRRPPQSGETKRN